MNRILRAVSIAAALCSTPALAEVESWYTYWGIGLASHNYPGDVDAAFRQAESYPGVSRSEMSLEVLGFYWPLKDQKTLLGGIVSGSLDALDDGYSSVQLNQYLYSFSAMHFYGEEPGRGFFLRGDVGLAAASLSVTTGGGFFGNTEDIYSESGYGALVGAGYGFAISEETRIILNLTYSGSRIDDDTYSTMAFNVAGLW